MLRAVGHSVLPLPPAPRSALSPTLRRLTAAAVALVPLALLPPPPAQAGMIEQIIFSKCSSAMQADFEKAGKTPPEGMIDFTCTCVVQKINQQQSINQAKTACSKLALQKYGVV